MSSQKAVSKPFKVVIVGGGIAGLEAALVLHDLADDLVATTVLSPEREFSYMAASVREPFAFPRAERYPVSAVISAAEAHHHRGTLTAISPDRRIVYTSTGDDLAYDAVLLAQGARRYTRYEHAITLDPPYLDQQLHGVIQDIEFGAVRSVAFIVPPGPHWSLPLYELALQTATRAYEMNQEVQLTIITPEQSPLAAFGETASAAVAALLDSAGIKVVTGAAARMPARGVIRLRVNEDLQADRVIALPELGGPDVPGIPITTARKFISTDRYGGVIGLDRVFAAGDIVDFPFKQGGLAAQEALVAATSIARLAGAAINNEPFTPTIHGLLWGPRHPLYMRAQLENGGVPVRSEVSQTPLWDLGAKVYAPNLNRVLMSQIQAA